MLESSATRSRGTVALAVSLSLGIAASAPAGGLRVVGFDRSRAGEWNLGDGALITTLRDAMARTFAADIVLSRELTPAVLSGADLVLLSVAVSGSAAITPLSGGEQTALLDFVRAGGGAVIFTDNDSFSGGATDPANESLLDPFGFDTDGTGFGSSAAVVPSPLTSALTDGPFGAVERYSVEFPGWFGAWPAQAILHAFDSRNNRPVLASIGCNRLGPGSGGVVLTSDASGFLDVLITEAEARLALNAIAYARRLAFIREPQSAFVCPRSTAVFQAPAQGGAAPALHYRWQREVPFGSANFVDLVDGPNPDGFVVAGASGEQLAISPPSAGASLPRGAATNYRCVVTTDCGRIESQSAGLNICIADVDNGTSTGLCDDAVTLEDLLYFIRGFTDGSRGADIDDGSGTGTPDGGVTIEDLLYYVARYESGC